MADNPEIPIVKTKVRTLATFKNGLAFVYRSGEAAPKNGWVQIEELPQAALGSLWIGTTKPTDRIEQTISFKTKAYDDSDVFSIGDILDANVGRNVTIFYNAGTEIRTATGKILSASKERRREHIPSSDYYSRTVESTPALLMETVSGEILAVTRNSISSVVVQQGGSSKMRVARDVTAAKVKIAGDPRSAGVSLAYLEKGITWSPSYLINLKSDKEAEITLEAVLVNDVEDIEDAEVSFVVGYPNFMFSNITSPIIAQKSVADFIQALATGSDALQRGGEFAGALTQAVVSNSMDYDADPGSIGVNYTTSQPMPGESNQDLYFYRQPNVTLKKGERARYTVFSEKIPYEHIYQLEIPDSMGVDTGGYRSSSSSKPQDSADQVWHALRLTNSTNMPWTTAPTLAVNNSLPVAQSMLKYTPASGKNTLKLTVATDIRAEQSQTEISREIRNIASRTYDEVTVSGKLMLRNYKQQSVRMNVKKTITGQVIQTGQNGKVARVVKNLTAVNPQSEVEWDFDLAPGAEKELTYQYTVFLNR